MACLRATCHLLELRFGNRICSRIRRRCTLAR
jgi:hypothetical protein